MGWNPIYIYCVEAVVVMVITIPLEIMILVKAERRAKKDFITIFFLLLADTLYAVSMLISQMKRVLFYNGYYDPKTAGRVPASACTFAPNVITFFIAVQILGSSNLALAVDRLYAAMWPTKYYKHGPRFAVYMMGWPYIVAIGFYIVNIILNVFSSGLVPDYCTASDFPNAALDGYYTYNRMASVVVTVAIYAVIGILLRKQSTRLLGLNESQKSGLRSVNITSALTATSAVVLLLVPEIMLKFGNLASDVRSAWYCVMMSKSLVNLSIFIWRHREFRQLVFSSVPRRRSRNISETDSRSPANIIKVTGRF